MSQNPEVKLARNTELAFTEAHLTYLNRKIVQASLFAKNNIMTILQNVNNTMAGYQKEILPSSWSPKSRLCNSNMQCSSNSGFSAGGAAAPTGYATALVMSNSSIGVTATAT